MPAGLGRAGVAVAIVDDHPLLAESLARSLAGAGFDVLAPVEAVEALPAAPPRAVVVCDLRLGAGRSGPDAIGYLVGRGWPVLAMSGLAGRPDILAAVAAGARGFVNKVGEADAFVAAVAAVAHDGYFVSPKLAGFLLDDAQRRPLRRGDLIEADLALLRELARGERLREIAELDGVPIGSLVSRLATVVDAAGRRDRQYRPTAREREVLELIGCRGRTQDAAARMMDVTPNWITGLLTEIKRKYLALHPEAEDDLKPSFAAILWARELRLCAEETPTDDGR